MPTPHPRWIVDPEHPRAPPAELWAELSEAERAEIVDSLPTDWPNLMEMAPEGDHHAKVVADVKDVLDGWYRRGGRAVYLATGMMVYYPDKEPFAPDVLAVVDAVLRDRDVWAVSAEGRGLDVCIEVHWRGRQAKDLKKNVQRYAELGIPEYFVLDRRRMAVRGWRLASPGDRSYEPIMPQGGRWASRVLGLDVGFEGERFRFYASGAVLPATAELLDRASRMVDELQDRLDAEAQRAEAEAQRAEAEAQRAKAEAQRASDAAARILELERLLEQARKGE